PATTPSATLALHDALPISGLHQGGAGALVAAAGAAYDLVHGDAALLEQLPGDGGRQVVPEVAGDRGQVRGVRLEAALRAAQAARSEEHTSELQSRFDLVCR